MTNVSGDWSGHITGTNNANVFVEITQNGIQVNGTARVNDPVYGTAIHILSGTMEDEKLQVELRPDMSFFDKRKHQTLYVNGQAVTVKLDPAFSHGIVTVNARLKDASSLDGLWKSTIGTGGRVFLRRIEPVEYQNSENQDSNVSKSQKIFISYSHKDLIHLERLKIHMKPLEKQGLVELWDDTKIKVGDRWEKEIEMALHQAAIAILIISADFLASDFIIDNELPPLLAKAQLDGTRIVPVILSPCRFSRYANLPKFQTLNQPDDPVLGMKELEQEAIWDRLSRIIEDQIGV